MRVSPRSLRPITPTAALASMLLLSAVLAAGLTWTGNATASPPLRELNKPNSPAQATPVPPIATCPPPPVDRTPTPPGLYPLISVDHVVIHQEFLPDGCPTTRMLLRICIRNNGPGSMDAFAVRVQGCGVGAIEVMIDGIERFDERCIEIPDAQISPGDCAIMLDPGCGPRCCFDRHWTGPVPHPRPLPTCTPTGTAATATAEGGTATATASPTQTAESSSTPTPAYAIQLPWAAANR